MLMGHNAMDNNIAGRVFLVTGVVSGYRSGGVRCEGGVRGNVTTCVCLF